MATIVGRLIATVGVDAKAFEKGLKEAVAKVEAFDKRFAKVGKKLGDAGRDITLGITAPLAGLAAAAIKSGGELERAVNRGLAVLEERPADAAAQLRALSVELSERFPRAASDIADSFRFLAAGGLDFEQSMKALPTTLAFAEAGMFDLGRAVDIVTDVLAATGGSAGELTRFSDLIVKGSNIASTGVEELAEAVTNKAGPSFRSAGQSAEELVAALLVLAEQGVKGAEAGTQLDIAIREVAVRAVENADAFRALGIEVFDSSGEMRQFSDVIADLNGVFEKLSDVQKVVTASQLGFSVRSSQFLKLFEGQTPLLRKFVRELQDAGDATDRVANENISDAISQLKILGNTLANTTAEGFEVFKEDIKTVIGGLKDMVVFVRDVVKLFGELPGPVRTAGLVLAGVLAAAGPVLLGIAAFTKGLASAKVAVLALRTAVVFLASSTGIGLLVVALGTLGGAALLAATDTEALSGTLDKAKVSSDGVAASLKETNAQLEELSMRAGEANLERFSRRLGLGGGGITLPGAPPPTTGGPSVTAPEGFPMPDVAGQAAASTGVLTRLGEVAAGVGAQIGEVFTNVRGAVVRFGETLVANATTTTTTLETEKTAFQQWAESIQITGATVAQSIKGVFDSLVAGLANSVANAIVFGEDLATALTQTLKQVAAQLISTLIQLAIQYVTTSAIGVAAAQTETAAKVGGATASATAKAIEAHAGIPFIGLALGLAAAVAIVAAIVSNSRKNSSIGRQVGFQAAAAAGGGVFDRPTLTLLGEGREPELVAPFSKLDPLLGDSRTGGEVKLVIELDGRMIAQRTVELLPDVVRVQGIF